MNKTKLINASVDINDISPFDSDAIGFGAKCIIAGCLPYKSPSPALLENGCWVKTNGEYSLWIQGGPKGIPYGAFPRVFAIWLTGEAIRTGKREIYAGDSIRDFLRRLGVDPSRGKRGSGKRLIDQTTRFLEARAAFRRTSVGSIQGKLMQFADDYEVFWEPRNPDQTALFDSYITLSQSFFEEITRYNIPLDMRAISALKSAPMALDIYQWLAYRLHYIPHNRPSMPTWEHLKSQFGTRANRLRDFRKVFLHNLRAVYCVYPDANFDVMENGLLLKKSKPPVPPKLQLVKS